MPRQWLPGTIRGLALTAALLLGLVTSLLGLLTYAVVHEEIERQIDHRIENETNALLDYHRKHGIAALAEVVRIRDRSPSPLETGYLAGVDDADRTMGHIVIDARGTRLVDTLGSVIPPVGWSEFLTFRKRDGETAIAQATNSPLPGGGQLIVAADRSVVDHIDLAILKLFVAAFAVLLAMGAAATLGLGRVVRLRLGAIEADAAAIMAGDMTRRMALDGTGGEFDRLAGMLNQMLDRIGELVTNLRQVSSDIAHDMRTPLTRLRQRLELAERGDAEMVSANVAAAGRAADDLLELFAALLAISEIEGQSVRRRFAPVVLDDAVREMVDAYRPAFADSGRDIAVNLAPALVLGDRRLLQQCVANLLDNVLLHTPVGSDLSVDIVQADNSVLLRIADAGPGVPDEDCERIFERLARLENSRSGGGHGLGLSMVMAIARAHSGSARAYSPGRGFAIEIALPALAPPVAA